MGYYLERDDDGFHHKAAWLIEHAGAMELSGSGFIKVMASMSAVPEDMMLVCVVDNGNFEAAGLAYDERERDSFNRPDGRPKRWLLVPKAEVLRQKEHLAAYINGEKGWRDR